MIKRLRELRIGDSERGIAMVLVLGIGAILAILIAGGVAYAVSGQKFARNGQDWDGALSAAYAGIEEYQSRMASDPGYWRYGNTAAGFSSTSTATMTAPPIANAAFGLGPTGTWSTVPDGGTGTSPGRYRYEVDNSVYGSTGILRLRTTGNVGSATRTLVADLKQDGFLDFLYFTDYEIRDPLVSNSSCAPAYQWASPSRPNCTEIQFAGADILNGPVHSNDSLLICGATFTGHVTTANSAAPFYRVPGGCGQPSAGPGRTFVVESKSVIGMPSTNSELRREVRSDLPEVPNPGCLYTGPTTIQFLSNGKMTVVSPWTKLTNVVGQPATSGSVSARCGTPGASGLGRSTGETVDVPTNGVIYVQNIPGSVGPNYSSDAATGTGVTCRTPAGGLASGNGVGFPVANEVPPSVSSGSASYGCRNGDVFVKGDLSGQVTVAAENYVYVTNDLRYVNPQRDLAGLVGQNAVWIWKPVKYVYGNGGGNPATGWANVYSTDDRRVDAALLSVAHSFGVQNYDRGGELGTLTINGAIAQKFRGTVATTDSSGNLATGYFKNYLYDTRFRYMAPPKFLSPVTTTYKVTVWIETNRAFDPQGYQLRPDGSRAP